MLEALGKEDSSKETVKGLIYAMGLLAYRCDVEGEVEEVFEALDAKSTIEGKIGIMAEDEALVREVMQVVA